MKLDCTCKDWKENMPLINGLASFSILHGSNGYKGKYFEYCPWCGKEIPELEETPKMTEPKSKSEQRRLAIQRKAEPLDTDEKRKELDQIIGANFILFPDHTKRAIRIARETLNEIDRLREYLREWQKPFIKMLDPMKTYDATPECCIDHIIRKTKEAVKMRVRNYLIDRELSDCGSWSYEELEKAIEDAEVK